MNVLHFIGSEAKGGNVRYAQVMHSCLTRLGLPSVMLGIGQMPTREILKKLTAGSFVIVFHATRTVGRDQLLDLRKLDGCRLIVFAHNPQLPKNWDLFDVIVPVSEYVRRILLENSSDPRRIYSRPAYLPILDLMTVKSRDESRPTNPRQNSEYDWDRRKLRDFFLSYFDRIGIRPWRYGRVSLMPGEATKKSSRIRLGIVSRIARLKQFPQLFELLHEGLVHNAGRIEVHIIGSGSWNQIQALKYKIPEEVRSNVYFWGWQLDPWGCLPKIDALLLGMPQKEALGLNALEATMRKIPVIGINGGPFAEVIETGRNGWLLDTANLCGEFTKVISRLEEGPSLCAFEMTSRYEYCFSRERFDEVLTDLANG